MVYALLATLLVALDQLSKYLVRSHIPLGGHVPFVPGLMELTYVQNTGAAFSLFSRHTWLLSLLSAAVVLVLLWVLYRGLIRHPFGVCALTLVIAGGVGNLIDRVLFGFVTDMFNTLFIRFAVFNVADICITLGGAAAAVYVLFFYERLEGKGAV